MSHIGIISILSAALLISSGCSTNSLPRARANEEIKIAVDSFIRATETFPQRPDYITLHSVMLVKDGKVLEERWLNGAAPDIPHVMHSVSKTFTAVAAGFAVGEGLLSLDDKVISFFPDQLPEEISENLSRMTVRDLLTMTCGHRREASQVRESDEDWVKGFLAYPVEEEPGTYFAYNSLGTYMVSAIIQKLTSMTVNDYLDSRLYRPLEIEKPEWETSPQGINCGGWGLYIKTEDMAKLGQVLLDGGRWRDRQVIPQLWVKEMTSFQVSTARPFDKRADWTQGYCYFMWRCTHNGVRADGSEGQYIILLPDLNAQIILTTESTLYQPYLDLVWKYLLPALE